MNAPKGAAPASLVDAAYEQIRRRILDIDWPPGHRALEQEVALALGMSRTPVREALMRLQAEGLVEVIPRHGMRVLPVSPNDMREALGRVRGAWSRWRGPIGFLADNGGGRRVVELDAPPPDSLLCRQLDGAGLHQDSFELVLERGELPPVSAQVALAALLQGFLDNPPLGVSRLMQFRNALVKPMGLRTSPLGCPVSSLLAARSNEWFATRFPVLAQQVDTHDRRAQVVLGADDRHLAFRSCVGVELRPDGRVAFTLGTRVRTRNLFGSFYMAAINRVHRGYVTPAMLRLAADHAVRSLSGATDTSPDTDAVFAPG